MDGEEKNVPIESVSVPDDKMDILAENHLLKSKLQETEAKLVKFKNFVVTLRNERNQLNEKVNENNCVIEKLKSQLNKNQNSNQLFQNLQNLQNEYDKCQDEIDKYKKAKKMIENNFLKCMEELNQLKVTNSEQQDEIKHLKSNMMMKNSEIETQRKSISEFESKIINLESQNNEQQAKFYHYQSTICELSELKNQLLRKTNEVESLSYKLTESCSKLNEFEKKIQSQQEWIEKSEFNHKEMMANKVQTIFDDHSKELEKYRKNEQEYNSKMDCLQKLLVNEEISKKEMVASLELEIYDLKNKLQLSESDMSKTKELFDQYKVKVANVLKENKLNNCDYGRNMEMLNMKIESIEQENNSLRNELTDLFNQTNELRKEKSSVETELAKLKNEKNDCQLLKQSIDELAMEKDKLNNTIKQLQISFVKEKSQIVEANKDQMNIVKDDFENKIKNLELELSRLRNSSSESNSVVNSNTSFEEIKDENSSIQSNVSSFEKNFLEEILCNESAFKSPNKTGLNVDNLAQLLADSENNISLLTEQNRVLKDEIRRLHRNMDRIEIADNLEYLKNVLLKFFTIKSFDEKDRLINVLSTILKLSAEEISIFHQYVPDNLNNKSSSWNLWQWSS